MSRRQPITSYTVEVRVDRGEKDGTTRHTWHAVATVRTPHVAFVPVCGSGDGKKAHVAIQRAVMDGLARFERWTPP